jgi:hypothetical protein
MPKDSEVTLFFLGKVELEPVIFVNLINFTVEKVEAIGRGY